MSVWILTSEHNDYDQHGEYFIAVFDSKPTEAELIVAGVPKEDVPWVLKGGGRKVVEDIWFHLREHLKDK